MDVTIGNGLESDVLEELAYYNWLIKEIDDIKKTQSKKVYLLIEVLRSNRMMFMNTFVLIEAGIILIDLSLIMIIIKKRFLNYKLIKNKGIQPLLITFLSNNSKIKIYLFFL